MMVTANSEAPPLIAIMGPTATGKTVVAAQVAKALNADVISADSQLVYRELSIGVAKPTTAEMAGVTHRMIDVVDPSEQYSAGLYAEQAMPFFQDNLSHNRPTVIAGGTGFYIRSLLQPDHLLKIPPNPSLREKLAEQDSGWLHETLTQRDPSRAQQIEPQDTKRLIRALEIIEALGGPVPETPRGFAWPVIAIGLTYSNRERHVEVISKRLDDMIDAGFMREALAVYERYGDCPGLRAAHGYQHLLRVHRGELTLDQAREDISIMIRQYSKRQMTWLRSVPDMAWFTVDTMSQSEIIHNVLEMSQNVCLKK